MQKIALTNKQYLLDGWVTALIWQRHETNFRIILLFSEWQSLTWNVHIYKYISIIIIIIVIFVILIIIITMIIITYYHYHYYHYYCYHHYYCCCYHYHYCQLLLLTITAWWFQPLWKILVSWDDYSQYMENSKCSKPPTRKK